MVAGDFNFVLDKWDRWCTESKRFTGDLQNREAKFWSTLQRQKPDFAEIPQDEHTHMSSICSSRLDRVYLRSHMADAQDRDHFCVSLQFDRKLSNHRPISFGRRAPVKKAGTRPLPTEIFKTREWRQAFDKEWSGTSMLGKTSLY